MNTNKSTKPKNQLSDAQNEKSTQSANTKRQRKEKEKKKQQDEQQENQYANIYTETENIPTWLCGGIPVGYKTRKTKKKSK